jgi:hypothetical protein
MSVSSLLLLFGSAAALTWIGPSIERGDEDHYWDNRSVVYATIITVNPVAEKPNYYSLKLRVHATITGKFDVAAKPAIVAGTWISSIGSALYGPPAPGIRALVLLRVAGASYEIPPAVLHFMSAGIREVKGYDDPIMNEVITRLRKLRIISTDKEIITPRDKLDPLKSDVQD